MTIGKLGNKKKMIIYQWLHDKHPERTISEKISIFKDLGIDSIFRGLWYCPDSHCIKGQNDLHYYTDEEWLEMENVVSQIKTAIPNIKINGMLGPRINRYETKNYSTGQVFNAEECWDMYLDPHKWGINVTKEDAVRQLTELSGGDLTNSTYYEIILSRAKKYIDIGCDSIFIDEMYKQAGFLKKWSGDVNHRAVDESWDAASNLLTDTRNYFISKGKTPVVGTWFPAHTKGVPWYTNNLPKLDFIVATRSYEAGYEMVHPLNFNGYKPQVERHHKYFGNNVETIYFLDDPYILTPFAQCLNIEQQKEKLREIKRLCDYSGMIFAYPVHGLWMVDPNAITKYCNTEIKKSYGLYDYYDSMAPEFQTYDTIKELIQEEETVKMKILIIVSILVVAFILIRGR